MNDLTIRNGNEGNCNAVNAADAGSCSAATATNAGISGSEFAGDRANDDANRLKHIEGSLRKKYKHKIFNKFVQAICDYDLIRPGDRIAVCISGGKDSMLCAKLFQELKRRNKIPFEVKFLSMDPGYTEKNRKQIEDNAALLNIPITFFNTKIFDSVFHVEQNPCYLCAKMRRGFLYRYAQEAGCNKIALGHHFDDIIETNLMSMIYGGEIRTMMPKVKSANWEGMELIRPLYYVREADIKNWRDENHLQFLQCACRFTERIAAAGPDDPAPSKRQEIKQLIAKLSAENRQVPDNIFHAMENVNLSVVLNYKLKGKRFSTLDDYDCSAPVEEVDDL